MDITFKIASPNDAVSIGSMVCKLLQELDERSHMPQQNLNRSATIKRCERFLMDGDYTAILGFAGTKPIATATITETCALYAQGKIGIIQEFFVMPDYRSQGIGGKRLEELKRYGQAQNWSRLELCTPPLPDFDRTLGFYKDQGLEPLSGCKMKLAINDVDTLD